MATYGYIENGVLHTIDFEGAAPKGYKPLEAFDATKAQMANDEYIIKVTPYDAGDRIAYRYEKKFDTKKIKTKITALKDELANSDYRIIKCYEAVLTQTDMPYDVDVIHSERQSLRNQINELENKLLNA